jgi:2-isopropylmalate synthase
MLELAKSRVPLTESANELVTPQIFETSRLVSRLTGYPVQYNKAVVGRNAFAHESGIHQHGVLRDRETYEIMNPAAVGQPGSQIVLGKHSGRAGFADALDKLDIVLEDADFQAAFDRFKELADRKFDIKEAEIRVICSDTRAIPEGLLSLVSLHVASGNTVTPEAQVTMLINGVESSFSGTGDGMVHATFAALRSAFATEAKLIDYRIVPVTTGADAMAEINVVVQVDGETYAGRSVDTDVVEGSARAFVDALNKAV